MSVRHFQLRVAARWSALPIALVVSAAMLWNATQATFTANTTNPTSNWTTGTVALSDDDSGTAMFNATLLKPGSTSSRCVVVTYNGTAGAQVKLFGTGKTATNSLDTRINLTVQQGTGGTYAAGEPCTGFTPSGGAGESFTGTLASFATTYTSSQAGFGTWAPTGAGQTRVYRVTYTIDAATPNSMMSSTASIGLTWEASDGGGG